MLTDITVIVGSGHGTFNYFAPHGESSTVGWIVQPQEVRRANMLAVLDRLQALKESLREKYGDFDVDEDIRAMREERSAYLDELIDGDHRS